MKSSLPKAADKVVQFKLDAVDKLIADMVEPLADVGNPEKVIKKPYEQWTPDDLAMLTKIYGQSDPSPLTNLIFRKEKARVEALEREEI